MTTASVIGREFDFRLLVRLDEVGAQDQVLEVFEEALGARIIEEPAGTTGRYQFTHALIQETLAQELSTTRRARLHACIAQALEELYGANADTHAAELAHHFAEAELILGPDTLVRYSRLAGEQALASYAYEDALAHFERGLVAREIPLSGKDPAPDEEAAYLLFGLARAWSATAEHYQLWDVFDALSPAFEFYAGAGNVDLAVAAAEFHIAAPTFPIPGNAALVARALTLVPADSHEAGRLFSRYGGIIGSAEGDYEGAQQALEKAMAIAKREGDVTLEVESLNYAATVSANHLRWQESVNHGLRGMELAAGHEIPFADWLCRWWTVVSLLRLGDCDAARPHVLALRNLVETRGIARRRASSGFSAINYLSCLEGDWQAGREDSGRGLELTPLNPSILFPRIVLEYETGDFAQGDVFLEQLFDAMRQPGPERLMATNRVSLAILLKARITGVPDQLDVAEAAARGVLSEQSVAPIATISARLALALLAMLKADRTAAKEHHAYLLEYRGSMTDTALSVDRVLGLLSHIMGNVDEATVHFEEALSFCRKAGYRPELAWSCCDYADMLLAEARGPSTGSGRTGGAGGKAKAKALLDESLAISSELGMKPLIERANNRLEQLEAQPYAAPAYPDGLTDREVEVLRLIAAGKTNLEISEELVIAEGTARRHVANIYEKIGAANRAEATRYTLQAGLVFLDQSEPASP